MRLVVGNMAIQPPTTWPFTCSMGCQSHKLSTNLFDNRGQFCPFGISTATPEPCERWSCYGEHTSWGHRRTGNTWKHPDLDVDGTLYSLQLKWFQQLAKQPLSDCRSNFDCENILSVISLSVCSMFLDQLWFVVRTPVLSECESKRLGREVLRSAVPSTGNFSTSVSSSKSSPSQLAPRDKALQMKKMKVGRLRKTVGSV